MAIDRAASTEISRGRTSTEQLIPCLFSNISRHAQATKVAASLSKTNGRIRLEIKDNGVGIADESLAKPQSFGLLGMRERVHQFNGSIIIKGYPNKGTMVLVTIPLARSSKKQAS